MTPAELYCHVRRKEGRLLPDELVARLPHLPGGHPLAGEWRARADSARRLVCYLARKPRPLHILDLGCGNGWLANRLAQLPGARVVGVERLTGEIAQAQRLFASRRLAFLVADVFRPPWDCPAFDVIVLASVIQYFPRLDGLIQSLKGFLAPGGEIHILDSPLYPDADLPLARERSRAYYAALGVPEMAGSYFHHPASALEAFSPRWLYRPRSWLARPWRWLGRVPSPFPWVVLA